MDFVGSGTTRSSSNTSICPRPSHFGHAPYGLLNEKFRAKSASKLIPQSAHAFFSENICGVQASPAPGSWNSACSTPSPCFSASSIESVSRPRILSATTSRSTTAAMECFFCLSSFGGFSISTISPSTCARVNPSRRADSKTSTCSPLRPSTSGASSCTFVPSGFFRIWLTISSALCRAIGLPHWWQC